MPYRVLIVEDDAALASVLADSLVAEGIQADRAADGAEAIVKGSTEGIDLILLDLLLPCCNGFEVCRELRARGIQVPILMLTARDNIRDKVAGLDLGADDYLTKPFDVTELLARVHALLRRCRDLNVAGPLEYTFGDVSIDFQKRKVVRNGLPVSLSNKEMQLLRYLIARRGKVLLREELLSAVWGYAGNVTRTLDVHIASLREKLEATPHQPSYIQTVRGKGYLFRE